jgi:hypothetical protein
MSRIADLLDRDLSRPIEEMVSLNNDDQDTVYRELTEYVVTDRIRTEYDRLFSAMAAAPKSPNEGAGVWISGLFGSGKSSFAKNLGYVLANRTVRNASASSLFLNQVESDQVAECVQFLNQAVPYEIFMFDMPADASAPTNTEQIAEVMYRVLLRELDYAEDYEVSELEIDLEGQGHLGPFQDRCQQVYKEDWRSIRNVGPRFERASALLHELDPRNYASSETWLEIVKSRPERRLTGKDLVERVFDLCARRRPGRALAFVADDMGQYIARSGERLEGLCALIEQFGAESRKRLNSGKIPGPAWVIVTAEQRPQEVYNSLPAAGRLSLGKLHSSFKHQVDLSGAGIRDIAARRVLRKKQGQEAVLRKLFRDHGASLNRNVRLERCSRTTEFDEDQFVQFYPYLPHLIDLSVDIVTGIRQHPNAAEDVGRGNGTIVKQSFEMLVSDRTRVADQPVGILVSIDKIYELVERNIPPEQQKNILDIRQRLDAEKAYPELAGLVAKAICLMEFAKTDLPRTSNNIAALLVGQVTEAPPTPQVTGILGLMKKAQFVRETEDGWTLYDIDELRRAAATMEELRNAVGTINPRLPGWRNDLIQMVKKLLARVLAWYMRPLIELNASVSRSLEKMVWTLDRHSTNMATLERVPMDMVALEGRLAQSENRNRALAESMREQLELLREQVRILAGLQEGANPEVLAGRMATDWQERAQSISPSYVHAGPGKYRTAYVIGLFGTGRGYIAELILQNLGERAKYFRDTLGFHPGPTPMIYSGHATMRHVSRAQEPPAVMNRVLEAVRSGFADVIFTYRHPLDSCLTNWIWWRTYLRDNRPISGISQLFRHTDDLCRKLEENFCDFKAFAEGDPEFFAGVPGPRFLSFPEFVEETELHLQSATLALRLEDFMIDPLKEFSKMAEILAVDLDLSHLSLTPPRTQPYGYLAVKDKVPRFRDFINGLDEETKGRIRRIGYSVGE